MKVRELITHIERTAAPENASSWDRSGVQIAGTRPRIERLAVTLDPLPEVLARALDWNADFILTHHPLAITPGLPSRIDDYHTSLSLCLPAGTWLYAAHTSLDAQPEGPVSWLAEKLELQRTRVLEPVRRVTAVKLCGPVADPDTFSLQALQDQEGVISATLDDRGSLTATCWPEALAALRARLSGRAEVQRVEISPLLEPERVFGFGLMGDLPRPLPWTEFQTKLVSLLPTTFWRCCATPPETISRVAYCPGSGADLAPAAFSRGAQVFITGDVKYHQAQEAFGQGLLLDVGHFALEETMMHTWSDRLSEELAPQGCQVRFFAGRNPFTLFNWGNRSGSAT